VLYLAAIPAAYMHYRRLEQAHSTAAGGTLHVPAETSGEERPGRLN
jgi:hypothetical protein